jgi:hypothetical protein
MFRRGCELGRIASCNHQGAILITLGQRDAGLALLHKGCDAGDREGCDLLKQVGSN